jgi:hypothetical protein
MVHGPLGVFMIISVCFAHEIDSGFPGVLDCCLRSHCE